MMMFLKKIKDWVKEEWNKPTWKEELDEEIKMMKEVMESCKKTFEDNEFVCLWYSASEITIWKNEVKTKLHLKEAVALQAHLLKLTKQ